MENRAVKTWLLSAYQKQFAQPRRWKHTPADPHKRTLNAIKAISEIFCAMRFKI